MNSTDTIKDLNNLPLIGHQLTGMAAVRKKIYNIFQGVFFQQMFQVKQVEWKHLKEQEAHDHISHMRKKQASGS